VQVIDILGGYYKRIHGDEYEREKDANDYGKEQDEDDSKEIPRL